MPPKVTLIRSDGTTISVNPEQAERLKVLGYREETPEESLVRHEEAGKEAFYSEQAVQAGVEGLFRGASLGLTDYAFGDEDTRNRAKYNPGIAQATEIVGAIAPEFIPGLNVIAPSALVGRGAARVIQGTSTGAKVARGTAVGGAFGGAMAADHAWLAGDPVTAEAVLHGVGFGALFGAGTAFAGAKLTGRGEANVARGQQIVKESAKTLSTPQKTLELTTQPAFSALKAETAKAAEELRRSTMTVDAILSGNKKKMAQLGIERTMPIDELAQARKDVDFAFRQFNKAVNKEKGIEQALKNYNDVTSEITMRAGLAGGSGGKAISDYAQAKVMSRILSKFPNSVETFAKMTPEKFERTLASLEAAKKLPLFPNIGVAVDDAANKFQEALGLAPDGVAGMRQAWKQAKEMLKAERAVKAEKIKPEEPGFVRKVVAGAAGAFASTKTIGLTGSWRLGGAAYTTTRDLVLGRLGKSVRTPELVAARNATLGRIKQAVGNYQIKTGKAISTIGPKIEPLAVRLDGTVDSDKKDPSDLAMDRIKEFTAAASGIKDTLYRAIEPIAVEQPELGPALHNAGVVAFNAVRGMLPADPGVVSGLKSIWKPSRLQAAVMSKQISVFHDPVGAAEEMLATGIFDPIKVKALKEIAPATYQYMRGEIIMKLQEPGFLDNMQYRDQVALGTLVDIPIHSSMKPEYIAASQALHYTRNQPLPSPSIPGVDTGGRPSETTQTQAQVTTGR